MPNWNDGGSDALDQWRRDLARRHAERGVPKLAEARPRVVIGGPCFTRASVPQWGTGENYERRQQLLSRLAGVELVGSLLDGVQRPGSRLCPPHRHSLRVERWRSNVAFF